MCGISFVAAREKPSAPQWLPLNSEFQISPELQASQGSLSASEIRSIVSDELQESCRLSAADERKLANLEKLRDLQNQLVKYRNSKKSDLVAEIEAEIESLSSGPDPAVRSTNPHAMAQILARGPDFARALSFQLEKNHVLAFSSVLSLRQPFAEQPVFSSDLMVQFNGELYNDDCLEVNDTLYITEKLNSALAIETDRQKAISAVVSSLSGEFAIVITDTAQNKVYFAKDPVGKRSLLYKLTKNSLSISSLALASDSVETPGGVMHTVDLESFSITTNEIPQEPVPFHDISLNYEDLGNCIEQLSSVLHRACLARQTTIHPFHPDSENVELGILFSGGLDCTVLAAVIARNYVKMKKNAVIDLLTVGFENPRTGLAAGSSPDRQLSEQSWFELCQIFEDTCVKFRLVQVDVSYVQWLSHRQRVLDLISPCSTEMDLSIAIAFYFACRAQDCEALEIGTVGEMSFSEFKEKREVSKIAGYTSPAKVLFSGLGADELFGGYSRHENIFNGLSEASSDDEIRERYHQLSQSLAHDISVIYERNLGRDDRATSSWGKELRYPYLDDEFISIASEIEPHYKIKFWWKTQKTKKGEKRVMEVDRKHILRQLAQRLGLEMASKEIKRAIQFGAKSAKMEIGQSKTRGTDRI